MHTAARGIQAPVDVRGQTDVGAGRHFIAINRSGGGYPATGEDRITRSTLRDLQIRSRHK